MKFAKIIKATHIIEAIEDYSITANSGYDTSDQMHSVETNWFSTDDEFWNAVITDPEKYWHTKLSLHAFTICNWVARVPGLYWTDYSEAIRKGSLNQIAKQSNNWIEFLPPGKSKKVAGGIGTIQLAPDDEGRRMFSISSSCNASLGIPVLVFPDVIDALKLKEGDAVSIRDARWQPLSYAWSKRFSSTKNIPRGCLIVDSIDKISIWVRDVPVVYHPFSIMEYQKNDALLFDFVYITVDSKMDRVRTVIEDFFVQYATKERRNGEYLLNPDMVMPMFEARYNSSSEMQHLSEKSKLDLMFKRIRDTSFNRSNLDELIAVLPRFYGDQLSIRRLAKSIEVSQAILQDDSAASMSAQLINYCIDGNKIEELTDRMLVEYPHIFNS